MKKNCYVNNKDLENTKHDQRHETGRLKHARIYWNERDHCGWTGRPTRAGRPEANTLFNTPDI